MNSDSNNLEGNDGAVDKATGSIHTEMDEDQRSSVQTRRLSVKLTDRWRVIQKNAITKTKKFFVSEDRVKCQHIPDKYSHVFRHKSRWEHLKLSCAVCGIEFCYAAETAFVTPILLGLGLSIKYVTIIWCLSPLVGLILSPIFGSMSDTCQSRYGRRRPFIVMYSIGILLGLILVPCGHYIGLALGDIGHEHTMPSRTLAGRAILKANQTSNFTTEPVIEYHESFANNIENFSRNSAQNNQTDFQALLKNNTGMLGEAYSDHLFPDDSYTDHIQPWSIVFTVIGVVLLDFCSDACQSPARTYLLDVTIPSEHASGLSTFTIMCGLGGSFGYVMGAIDWDKTLFGQFFGGHINAVFTINAIIFIICIIISLSSFAEIPLPLLNDPIMYEEYQEKLLRNPKDKIVKEIEITYIKQTPDVLEKKKYGSINEIELNINVDDCDAHKKAGEKYRKLSISYLSENAPAKNSCKGLDLSQSLEIRIPNKREDEKETPKLKEYLVSIFKMPRSLLVLSFTNLLGWMSSICFSLYFTDFVGESVFIGNPHAAEGSPDYQTYQSGLQFGCWGLALFCASCGFYSLFIETFVSKLGAKTVYIGGQLAYSVGMIITGVTKHKVAVILLAPTAGIMYCTVFTLPYFLLADYHSNNQFSKKKTSTNSARGMGTDVAVISSMMFLAQFILSVTMGSVAEAVGSHAVPIFAAALLSACGALSATQVTYLNI